MGGRSSWRGGPPTVFGRLEAPEVFAGGAARCGWENQDPNEAESNCVARLRRLLGGPGMNSEGGVDGSNKIVPLRLSRKQIESTHERLVQWVEGEIEFLDYKVDAAEFFPSIGNKLFDAVFERWEAGLSLDPASPPLRIIRKW